LPFCSGSVLGFTIPYGGIVLPPPLRKDARKAGESEQRLYAVAAWQEAPFFSERDRVALALTDAVTLISDTHVPAAFYDEATRHFAPEELAHLIWQIAAINSWDRIGITTRQSVGGYQP
jgi:alkylhydroperoxidase family enzyme